MIEAHYIELIGKTVQVLETLRDEPAGLSLQELSLRTEQVKSSVHRILQSLKKHGYVEQDYPGGPYRLGLQVLTLARGLNGAGNLPQMARGFLREIVEKFDESAYLAVLRQGRGIFVDVQETRRDLRLVGPLGAEVHFHATAAGKAIAAFLQPDRQTLILNTLKATSLTPKTVIQTAQVKEEWEKVRKQGYAVNNEETIVGAIFLAVPVFDARHQVCGSISVGIPKPRYSAQLGKHLITHLKDLNDRLSVVLEAAGYIHEKAH